MIRRIFLGILFASIPMFVIYWQLQKQQGVVYESNEEKNIGGSFSLIDQHGQKRASSEFAGKYQLIYFGYSFCPDICPLGLMNMGKALNLLKRNQERFVPIFITIDPKRDSVESLNLYAKNFNPRFVMLTGDTAAAQKKFYVFAEDSKDGEINHSSWIYLMGPDGKFLQQFSHDIAPELMAKNLLFYLNKESKKQ